ncbi:DUF3618 domain-containing protein [Nocardia paucivorans]|uniref:DUF3618 domain-containing protein n=1 Tax=Nocardia paucivorans TaxID=114259 RepID=UPI0002D69847|nr:DUF3618 domain-containing protein [Nocardia paucivorans]
MTPTGRDGEQNEAELLREDRDRTRRELGRTVTELSDKFDVRARAEEKAHDIAEAGRHRAREAKHGALETADHARERAHGLLARAESATPAPVADRTRQLAEAGRTRPMVLLGGISAALVGWFLVRRLMPQRRATEHRTGRRTGKDTRRAASARRRLEARRSRKNRRGAENRHGRRATEHRRRGRDRLVIAGRAAKPIGRMLLVSRATTPLGAGTLLAASAKRRVDAERARTKKAKAAERAARRAVGKPGKR